jgi:hypothetical protein
VRDIRTYCTPEIVMPSDVLTTAGFFFGAENTGVIFQIFALKDYDVRCERVGLGVMSNIFFIKIKTRTIQRR